MRLFGFVSIFAIVPVCLAKGDLFEAKERPVLLARCSSCQGAALQMAEKLADSENAALEKWVRDEAVGLEGGGLGALLLS